MRWSPLLLAVLLAGCAHAPSAAPGSPSTGTGTSSMAGVLAGHGVPLHFAGSAQASNASFDDTFQPTEWCAINCDSNAHAHDLTAQVPAGVPVRLEATVTGSGDFYAYLSTSHVSYSSYHTHSEDGTFTLAVDILRAADGTVALVPIYLQPATPEAAPALHTQVGIRSDPSRVPAGQPVALALKPGDTVNATGDGVKGLYLVPPHGPPLRDQAAPLSIRVPDDGTAGTYVAIPAGAAAQLVGPDQVLVARRYAFHAGAQQDIPAGQAFAWDESLPDAPVSVGLQITCKQVADQGCSGSFRGNGDYTVSAPDGAQVYQYTEADCAPPSQPCDLAIVAGYHEWDAMDGFLDPHFTAGVYHAAANVQQGSGMVAAVVWQTIE
jgi:hypothetical protein